MSEQQIAALAEAAVADLAARLAARAFPPPAGPVRADADGPVPAWEAPARADALTRLHALLHLQHAVERLADRAAGEAAAAGAGYPQIGQAFDMSRQGARKRWPGLVGPAARAGGSVLPPG
ncbi:hypothetical protein ACFYNO_31100 [Kitasatospora sp. NPDC006697]|uniref:hypothetical protein n=1 Tax=Kitasatospora sp. NPDC006697 TaxID=3364020 RepID=UPI003696FB3A